MKREQEGVNPQVVYDEDEIDLKELVLTLWRKKFFIATVTAAITVAGVVYAFTKAPVYQVKSVIEIGTIGGKPIESDKALAKRMEVLFRVGEDRGIEEREAVIESIDSEKTGGFLTIVAEGSGNEAAKAEVQKVEAAIHSDHGKKIDAYLNAQRNVIRNIERAIEKTESISLKRLEEKVEFYKKQLLPGLEKKLMLISAELKELKRSYEREKENGHKVAAKTPELAALSLLEVRTLVEKIRSRELQLVDLENQKQEMIQRTIPALEDDIALLKTQTLARLQEELEEEKLKTTEAYIKKTRRVGEILENDFPVSPKKKLIVAVVFVTGAILSVFLVFFLEFVRNLRKETD